jgi:DNA gyrase/topoisomerase IV subunit A
VQADLVEQIAKLVDANAINGISDVRDESDRDGLRVVVEVKKGKCNFSMSTRPEGSLPEV